MYTKTSLYKRFSEHTRWKECVDFILIFGGVFVLGMVGMNYKALSLQVSYMFDETDTSSLSTKFDVLSIVDTGEIGGSSELGGQLYDTMVASQHINIHDFELVSYLKNRQTEYTLAFNTLPPVDYIRIPSLDVDAPIIQVPYVSQKKMETADFFDELRSGVVKYPFTANPGEKGSGLIFGHSSTDERSDKDNPYGYIFQQLGNVVDGDRIEVVWSGKLYTYEVDKKTVKRPEKVGEEIAEYTDNKYLTLMACYPLFSSAQRLLVRAKQIPNNDLIADGGNPGTLLAKAHK